MKAITPLFLAAATTFSINANAAPVHGDPDIADVFPIQDISIQPSEVRTVADIGNKTWSISYEEWVNPADFNSGAKQTIVSALRELEAHPPAAGNNYNQTFIWDENAGEYQLQ